MKNKRYHKKRTPRWYTVTSLLLKPIKQHHTDIISYRLSKSLDFRSVLFKRTNNFGSVLQIVWILEFSGPNSRHTSASPPPFAFLISLFLRRSATLLVNVAMLSRYQYSVNCKSGKVERTLRTKCIAFTIAISRLGIYVPTRKN